MFENNLLQKFFNHIVCAQVPWLPLKYTHLFVFGILIWQNHQSYCILFADVLPEFSTLSANLECYSPTMGLTREQNSRWSGEHEVDRIGNPSSCQQRVWWSGSKSDGLAPKKKQSGLNGSTMFHWKNAMNLLQGLCRTVFTRLVPDTEYVASRVFPQDSRIVFYIFFCQLYIQLNLCWTFEPFPGICRQRSLPKPLQICPRGDGWANADMLTSDEAVKCRSKAVVLGPKAPGWDHSDWRDFQHYAFKICNFTEKEDSHRSIMQFSWQHINRHFEPGNPQRSLAWNLSVAVECQCTGSCLSWWLDAKLLERVV